MIKAVISDYGEVLAHRPSVEDFNLMARMFNARFDLFLQLWQDTRDAYDRGDVSAEDYWQNLAQRTNSSLHRDQIRTLRQIEVEIWTHHDPVMLKWLTELGAAGIRTALLTNMPLDLVAYLRENCKWTDNFFYKTFSAEVRLIKPDPAIYDHTLRGLGVSARETLFVDDRETNVRAALALGIQAIQFQSIRQLKRELEKVGFPILTALSKSSGQEADASRSTEIHL